MGTRDDEKGDAPEEKGTFGLLVPLIAVPFPTKLARKEPAKKSESVDELVVMDSTSAAAPVRPPKGGADHDFALASYTATAELGDENLPPAQTLLADESQYSACTGPSGPLDASAANEPEEYDATLEAEVPLMDEKLPAT